MSNAHQIGSAEDRALDAATRGKVGTIRRGFHTAYTAVRFTDARSGVNGVQQIAERCTCTDSRYNHVATAR